MGVGLIALVRRIYLQLPGRLQTRLLLVLGAMLLGAVLDVLTLSTVIPFLAVLGDAGRVLTYLDQAGVAVPERFRDHDQLRVLVACIFMTVAVSSGVVRLLMAWMMNRFAFSVGRHLTTQLFEKLVYQDYDFHIRNNSSVLITHIQDLQMLTNGVLIPLMQAMSSMFIGICIIAALIYINPPVAAVAIFGFGGCYVLISFLLRKRLRHSGVIMSEMNAEKTRAVQESIGGIREVILDNTQPFFIKTFSAVDRAAGNAQAIVTFAATAPRYILEALGMVMIALISLYVNGKPGGLMAALPTLAALALGAQRLMPLMQMGYAAVVQLAANWRRLSNLLDLLEMTSPRRAVDHVRVAPLPFEKDLVLDNVTFRYGADSPDVLSRVSVSIPKGARVGFVGTTGSGKSTITDILLGLLHPTEGQIRIDGVSLTPENMRAWHEQIAHVPQSIFLADTSVERNIAFGYADDQIDKARVREAARQAQVSDFIESLPDGYDARVGERGSWMSGGQRQRIGIARALYKNASVLVLDEATSALDNATEAAIIASLEQLDRRLTIIIVAHRLSTIQNCDMVLRIEHGRVTRAEMPSDNQVAPVKTARKA
ncbi:ABC transporter ATP-binding protein [Phenylobacterium sp.]|uniref:ABC transporter ATP-binding protein n=1 Tax=Phenylobacterium sp. TaxID=1871053 RepID=UPI00286D629D|nr:ABC transporter ATP-binding protein [Phenylobacterium sp.]